MGPQVGELTETNPKDVTKPEPIYGYGALPPEAVPPILLFGDKRLRRVCEPVTEDAFSDDQHSTLRQGLQTLAAVLYRHGGAAIAAPQVGVLQRVIVVAADVAGDVAGGYPVAMINPVIAERADEEVIDKEGCLSFPKVFANVPRPVWVKVAARTPSGVPFMITARRLFARAICHELEHLDGTLLIDHTNGLKRQMIANKMIKFRRRLDKAAKHDAKRRK